MRTYVKLMENISADPRLLLRSECLFHQSEILVEQQCLELWHPSYLPSRSDQLNRAIVTSCSTTNCADALPFESGHVVLVLNMKCETNIFRFDPEH